MNQDLTDRNDLFESLQQQNNGTSKVSSDKNVNIVSQQIIKSSPFSPSNNNEVFIANIPLVPPPSNTEYNTLFVQNDATTGYLQECGKPIIILTYNKVTIIYHYFFSCRWCNGKQQCGIARN